MKLLVDANLSPKVAEQLAGAGYDAVHVGDHGLLAASDETIAAFAVAEDRTVVSADSDWMRSADALTPLEQAMLLRDNLPTVAQALEDGAVVSISRNHLRLRRLPLR